MLLGAPGVKPDRMIHRFLRHAAGHRFSNTAAEKAIRTVAALLGSKPHELDHAIWKFQSRPTQSGKPATTGSVNTGQEGAADI